MSSGLWYFSNQSGRDDGVSGQDSDVLGARRRATLKVATSLAVTGVSFFGSLLMQHAHFLQKAQNPSSLASVSTSVLATGTVTALAPPDRQHNKSAHEMFSVSGTGAAASRKTTASPAVL